jgi:hypothetical protein
MRIPKFSKEYKYLLGERLIDCNVEIIKNISEANSQAVMTKRVECIERILKEIDEMFVYIRIAEELKQFKASSAYPYLVDKLSDISTQATGWRNFYLPRNS